MSETVRIPGSHPEAAGSLATSSRSSATGRNAATTRSMMRAPRMSSSPFGCPPNRVARPPAMMAPVTRSAATVVRGPERLVLGDSHLDDRAPIAECFLNALEDEPREVLGARHQPSFRELGHVPIDVALVESRDHDVPDDRVEILEIDDEP